MATAAVSLSELKMKESRNQFREVSGVYKKPLTLKYLAYLRIFLSTCYQVYQEPLNKEGESLCDSLPIPSTLVEPIRVMRKMSRYFLDKYVLCSHQEVLKHLMYNAFRVCRPKSFPFWTHPHYSSFDEYKFIETFLPYLNIEPIIHDLDWFFCLEDDFIITHILPNIKSVTMLNNIFILSIAYRKYVIFRECIELGADDFWTALNVCYIFDCEIPKRELLQIRKSVNLLPDKLPQSRYHEFHEKLSNARTMLSDILLNTMINYLRQCFNDTIPYFQCKIGYVEGMLCTVDLRDNMSNWGGTKNLFRLACVCPEENVKSIVRARYYN